MAIICIAREIGALGEEIAAEISSKAGLKITDREDIEAELSKVGVARDKLERFDEKRPPFWASLTPARDDYLHFLKSVILEEAAGGDRIFMGRGAGAILDSVPGVSSVKVVAPREERVRRVRESRSLTEKQAEQLVQRSDSDRQGYHGFFFGMDWRVPLSYDLVLNTGSLSAADAAAVILALARVKEAASDRAEVSRRLADLRLSQAVVTEIVYARRLPVQFLEADACDGVVCLHGVASSRVSIDQALAAAKEVKGVVEARSEIQVVQEYAAIP
jgi:cytidylate kinase